MKFLIKTCTILVLFLISSAEADCSPKSWNIVHNFDASRIPGRWYAVLRFANGKNDTSDCLWKDLRIHPTIPNALQDFAMRTFKDGERRRKLKIEGVLTLAGPSSTDGIFLVVFINGSSVLKYVTAADYDDFGIIRACFEGEEHLWVYTRNQFPSNSTMTKIYKEIDDQGIDRSKLIKSCTDVPAWVLV